MNHDLRGSPIHTHNKAKPQQWIGHSGYYRAEKTPPEEAAPEKWANRVKNLSKCMVFKIEIHTDIRQQTWGVIKSDSGGYSICSILVRQYIMLLSCFRSLRELQVVRAWWSVVCGDGRGGWDSWLHFQRCHTKANKAHNHNHPATCAVHIYTNWGNSMKQSVSQPASTHNKHT